MDQSYRLSGMRCGEDPQGAIETQGVLGYDGQLSVISMWDNRLYSRHSHLPSSDSQTLGGGKNLLADLYVRGSATLPRREFGAHRGTLRPTGRGKLRGCAIC